MIKSKKNQQTSNHNQHTSNRLCSLLLALCLLMFTATTTATIRYVSPTGNNIPPYLTWENAANVIQDAINICEAGDTVLVDNGTYFENLVINTQISLIGLSMDSTVIDGTGLGDFTIVFNVSGSIENFNIYGKGDRIGDAVIRNLQFTVNQWGIKNCKISKGNIGIGLVGGVNTSIQAENILMNNLNRGFSLSSEGENYIQKCLIILENQYSTGVGIGFAPNGSYYFSNNVILYTNPSISTFPLAGISVGAIKKAYIQNNIISGFEPNIYIDEVVDTVYILNNVISYGRTAGLPGGIRVGGEITKINNVIVSNNAGGIDGDFLVTTDYNLFWNNGTDLYGLSYGDSDRVADPMFIKDTLPNPQLDFDYHLQAYSPGIDAGTPDILDVDGSRSDMGLYGGPLGQSYKYKDLPPRPPVNLSAVVDTNLIFIKWNRNTEADTSHYNVYRDTVSNFTIDSTKLVSSQADTFYIELAQLKPGMYLYKITCVDNQGNESLPSEEILVDLTTAIDDYPITINDYLLYQNYPNPFNPSTKIGYKLKERGYVKLMVYDITGSLVSVLVNKEQEAGYYEVEFNVGNGLPSVPDNRILSSGIYLYRIEIIGEGRIPKFSDLKKMVFIK